jgi:hypothetical protein
MKKRESEFERHTWLRYGLKSDDELLRQFRFHFNHVRQAFKDGLNAGRRAERKKAICAVCKKTAGDGIERKKIRAKGSQNER